ncbi:chromosomal replication initiator protein DnaA [Christensenellaceae bacterium OttesenSCG-928-L17]|nr:chromosomal replication initiator protein DnaA [Christensenellaceae bacterium OttesenSCG-928-L17]
MESNNNTHSQVWERALVLLKKEMNTVSYRTFIEALKPVAIRERTLVLEAPNEVVQTSLQKFYMQALTSCVTQTAETLDTVLVALPEESVLYAPKEKPGVFSYSPLFPKYTFDTFVVGNANRFAHAAACAVAERPAEAYNPLFIYGGVGLGKTHLMQAVGHHVRENHPQAHVLYITSESFTNEMIQSIATGRNQDFRNRYRNVDVLMVDDIQFIARKEGVQEEFFHTFNALYTAKKQIIISSDKPPREIAALEERLRSRFEWGLIADIQPPDLETRIAILKRRAEVENCRVPAEVMEFIAEHVRSNIRELEGFLTRVIAYAHFNHLELTVQVAAEALKDMISNDPPREITPHTIKETVADYYGVDAESLCAKRRDQEIAFPRQVAMYLSRTMTDWSLAHIGDAFGGRNHTTVMHAHEKITEQMRTDAALDKAIKDLTNRLLEK